MTRAEFAVLMLRYLGLDGEDYAAVEVPFADMDKVDAWAANAVRAAYTLGLITGAAAGDQLIFDPQGSPDPRPGHDDSGPAGDGAGGAGRI